MIQLTNETKKDKDNKDIDDSLYLNGIDPNNLAIVRGTKLDKDNNIDNLDSNIKKAFNDNTNS